MTAAAMMLVMGLGHLALSARSLATGHAADETRTAGASRAPRLALRGPDWGWAGAAWVIAAVALVLTTGLPWASAVVALVVSALATVLLAARARLAAVSGFVLTAAAIALAVLVDGTAVDADAPLARMLADSAQAEALAPSVVVVAIAALVFLGPTSNALVRAIVAAARRTDEPSDAPPQRSTAWRVLRRDRELAVVRKDEPEATVSGFRGGRIVGPLERVLVFASLLAGMPVVIAGLVAAKGVVRFPEISADRSGGTKAEEFLVGTLCSFLLASLAVLTVVARS